ncbi:MAG: hypothetical protein OEZ59_10710 [Deltaproteobacteria bacterium]|nr:hypothetical protein [Deltaproteobacteria bacterium]
MAKKQTGGPGDAARVREAHGQAELDGLISRGVIIPAPDKVFIARDVPLEAIAAGAVIHPFSRISGEHTRIDQGAQVGPGGPAAVNNSWLGQGVLAGTLGPVSIIECAVGPGTVLGSGVAEQSVFLGREGDEPSFTTGYGFRVRKGTLYEEGACSAQHTDTKMTVLFPWVTLGSNVNWCDVLMTGGTGPGMGEFSEVGSGTIHFNFTARGDKATGSLLGSVCSGVFLREERLFIGGNNSIIGPLNAEFGAVTPAGSRHSGRLQSGINIPAIWSPPSSASYSIPHSPHGSERRVGFEAEVYGSVRRVFQSQVMYIAELAAMAAWYAGTRMHIAQGDEDRTRLYSRAQEIVRMNIDERIAQLKGLAEKMERSSGLLEKKQPGDPRILQQRALLKNWPRVEKYLREHVFLPFPPPSDLLAALDAQKDKHGTQAPYTTLVQGLGSSTVRTGKAWLRGVTETVAATEALDAVPTLSNVTLS